MDLDPEIIFHALEGLCASDQARARLTCKLFAVVIEEVTRTASFMASAVGPLDAVFEELSPSLKAPPTMGILFSKDDVDSSALSKAALQLPFHLECVGGHMSVVAGTNGTGLLMQSDCAELQVALCLGHFPEATVSTFAVDANNQDWSAQLEAAGAFTPGWKVFVIVARHPGISEIVDALQFAHPEAAIIGGMATGDQLYRIRRQQVQCMDQGVVGLMFSGNVPVAAFVSRGARGLGDDAYSFEASDLRTVEMHGSRQVLTHVSAPDGKQHTALEAAVESLQEAGARAAGLCIGLADAPEEGYELTPLSNDMVMQSESALLVPLRRGSERLWRSGSVRFYSFDPDSCRRDLTRRLGALKAEAARKGERLLGAVMFTCGGRTLQFFGERAFDATTFVRIFDGTPLVGMYAGGEIGPPLLADAPPSKAFQVGGAEMHGFTAIFGMFIVPERQPRASQLAFADANAVAAAYASLRLRASLVPPPRQPQPSRGAFLPSSVSELRGMPVRALKQLMARLSLVLIPGSEKEDLVKAIAPYLQ